MSETDIWLEGNNVTLKAEIRCKFLIDFTKPKSIGALLGFKKKILQPNITHVSDDVVKILKIETIKIICNLVSNSYNNNALSHTLYEFCPQAAPGFQIVEIPNKVIYLPLNTRNIDFANLKICDQKGNLLDNRGESIHVRLHIRPI